MKRNIAFGKFPAEPSDARERARLEALDKLDIMDTPPDEVFDRIAGLITQIFGVEMSIVSFIDAHRQWYKASCGMGASQVGRRDSFCQYTLEGAEPLIVRDASLDPRFHDHPAVIGSPYVRFYAGMPLRTREGHNVGTVCAIGAKPRMFSVEDEKILADLTRLAMNFFELKQVAISDSLTGALTRRAFREEANRAVALVTRQKSDLACIMIDIDHFKAINDTYGHAAGDEVLVKVSAALRATLRESDLLGRLGGEEFAIILPDTDRDGAAAVAEKLRAKVEALEFSLAGRNVKVTASFGISLYSLVTRDVDGLLTNADLALYQAKSAGRNRCCNWDAAGDAASARRRVLKAGQILFNGRRSTVDCTVRSLGNDSAGLEVSTTTNLPPDFTLIVRSDGFETNCKVTAMTDRHLEVRFS